ncbi:ATPase AAA [Orpheovirus IHUMI-LCC2]|uniref:ATPase AAA n=1 Tax=Orpheovirus IHUMI-LCC2 TaxID=2023057 RepID=A0A2I2L3R0_9VIRU|nr:ATPase AAA [Orpheovirus IHUMI-LCC2]SNW62182.1 ATPase AAA [Orpheovirus IHUMI-LCC2]
MRKTIIITGEVGSGKTTLIKYLKTGIFDRKYIPTSRDVIESVGDYNVIEICNNPLFSNECMELGVDKYYSLKQSILYYFHSLSPFPLEEQSEIKSLPKRIIYLYTYKKPNIKDMGLGDLSNLILFVNSKYDYNNNRLENSISTKIGDVQYLVDNIGD